jgi:hypothetical protein
MSSIDVSSDAATEIVAAKVLFIVTGATYWVLKDGTRYATGYWAEEFANRYNILTEAGHEEPHWAAVLGDRMLEILARADDLVRS